MSRVDSRKQERIHEFLRKSLLGQELINTQFHLFSARSATSRRLTKPRVLCANNVLLAKNSKYFLNLLSSDVDASDPSLSDLTDDHDVPSNVGIDDYGYESDSDFEDDVEELPARSTDRSKILLALRHRSSRIRITRLPRDDDELSQDGSESGDSDIFVMSPENPSLDGPSLDGTGSLASVMDSETVVQGPLGGDNKGVNHPDIAARLRLLGNRHILVKDTAFQTWYSLLNYLYTGQVSFLPLTSAAPAEQPRESTTSSLDEPKCSAKSMYRLACKVGLDCLRDAAFAHIRNNLSENNILEELSCSLVSGHPKLLEMELDLLYSFIASAPVLTGFPTFAKRIANKELHHGADIIVGIHTRILKAPLSWVKEPGAPPRSPDSEPTSTYESSPPLLFPPFSQSVGILPPEHPNAFDDSTESPIKLQPGGSFSSGFDDSDNTFSWEASAASIRVKSPLETAFGPSDCVAEPCVESVFIPTDVFQETKPVDACVRGGDAFFGSKKKKGGDGGKAKKKKK